MDPLVTRLIYLSDALVRAPAQYDVLIDRAFEKAPRDDRQINAAKAKLKQLFSGRFERPMSTDREQDKLREIIAELGRSSERYERVTSAALEKAAAALDNARRPVARRAG